MKFVISILILGLGMSGLVGGTIFPQYIKEIFMGMIAPLLVTILSIMWINKVFKADPEKTTTTMTKSFFIKMVLYAIYFIIILSFYTFEPNPFVVSFMGFFILFYAIEAMFLHKLFQSRK
ncbi:ATP synthase subunit I [Candidatus Neomarinimicrobiota bacterium]